MIIESNISNKVVKAIRDLYGQEVPEKMVQLQKTRSEFEGNLTLVVFPFLKMSKKKPEDTAKEIGEYLLTNEKSVANYNVVKGFLNLSIAPSAWIGLLNTIHANEHFGERLALGRVLFLFFQHCCFPALWLAGCSFAGTCAAPAARPASPPRASATGADAFPPRKYATHADVSTITPCMCAP